MSLIVKENTGIHIDPIDPGVYVGICYGVIDLGTHENKVFGGESHKVLISWELPDCRGQFEKDGVEQDLPRVISNRYTLSLNEKANLRKALESWRGRKFTSEELQGFDLRAVLGAACQIQVVHKQSKDGQRTFANVAAIMALPKGTVKPGETENDLLFFSFDDAGDPPEIPDLPEWIQDIIVDSKEWQTMAGENTAVAPTIGEMDAGNDEDDKIPF